MHIMTIKVKQLSSDVASQMMTVSHANNNGNIDEYERCKRNKIIRNIVHKNYKTWIECSYALFITFNKYVAWNYRQKHELIAMFYEYYYRRTKFSELLETEFDKIMVIAPAHQSRLDGQMHLTICLGHSLAAFQNGKVETSRHIHVKYSFNHASTSTYRHFRVTSMTRAIVDKTCQPWIFTYENI